MRGIKEKCVAARCHSWAYTLHEGSPFCYLHDPLAHQCEEMTRPYSGYPPARCQRRATKTVGGKWKCNGHILRDAKLDAKRRGGGEPEERWDAGTGYADRALKTLYREVCDFADACSLFAARVQNGQEVERV